SRPTASAATNSAGSCAGTEPRPPVRSRNPMDLTGKPIAITGASSGIGRATAIACARAGMPVAVGARRADRLESLSAEIAAAGGRAIAVQMDVDKPEDCQRLIDRTIGAFGSIYAVFANAGFGLHKPIHQ